MKCEASTLSVEVLASTSICTANVFVHAIWSNAKSTVVPTWSVNVIFSTRLLCLVAPLVHCITEYICVYAPVSVVHSVLVTHSRISMFKGIVDS